MTTTGLFADLEPGDAFNYYGTTVTVLGAHEPTTDLFGRAMTRFRGRRADTNAEGWMTYGPGGAFA